MTDGHASDCALHRAPAYEPGPCDCGVMTFWLLMRKVAEDWSPVSLYRSNDEAIQAGLAWEKSGYPISIKPVSVHETDAPEAA